MAAIVVGGRLLLGPALRIVARIKVAEMFTAAALLTVIITALLARQAGLSMSLGAFLAGVLLADSEFRHELEADSSPSRAAARAVLRCGRHGCQPRAAALGTVRGAGKSLRLPRDRSSSPLPHWARATAQRTPAWKLGFTCRPAANSPSCCSRWPPGTRHPTARRRSADAGGYPVDDARPAAARSQTMLARSLAQPSLQRLTTTSTSRRTGSSSPASAASGRSSARVLRAQRHPLHGARHQPDPRRLRAPLRQQGLLRGRLAAGSAACSRRRDGRRVRSGDRRCRGIDAHRACSCASSFPRLKILARARNRQHAFALKEAGVRYIIRETSHRAWRWPHRARDSRRAPSAGARGSAQIPPARRGYARRAVCRQGGRDEIPGRLARGGAAAGEAVRGRQGEVGVRGWTRRCGSASSGSVGARRPLQGQSERASLALSKEPHVRVSGSGRIPAHAPQQDEAIRAPSSRAWSSAPPRGARRPGRTARGAGSASSCCSISFRGTSIAAARAAFAIESRRSGADPLGHAIGGRWRRWTTSSGCSSTCRCSTRSLREVQEESVAAYRRLLTEAPEDSARCSPAALRVRHRSIGRPSGAFGRFPHRNTCLGRASTAEEEAYLQAAGRGSANRAPDDLRQSSADPRADRNARLPRISSYNALRLGRVWPAEGRS